MRAPVESSGVFTGNRFTGPLFLLGPGEDAGDEILDDVSVIFLGCSFREILLENFRITELLLEELLLSTVILGWILADDLKSFLDGVELAVVSEHWHRLPHVNRVLDKRFDGSEH